MRPLDEGLHAILDEAFRLLSRAVADRRSPFHSPTVVTLGMDGAPEARTVVLRAFDAEARTLTFHTDARAGKVEQLRADPRVAVHAYDDQRKIQLRMGGGAELHHDDDCARAAWQAATHGSRATYRVVQAPGAEVDDPAQVDATGLDEAAAYAQFMAVRVTLRRLEWLHLAASGHRRARFDWDAGGLRAAWLVP